VPPARDWQQEAIDCGKRQAIIQAANLRNHGRYRVGDFVRVLSEVSAYYLLIGRVVEITRFNDSGIIEFTDAMLQSARNPEQVTSAKRRVHFYWRMLQEVIVC
jgi:hypothetical protein